MAKRTTYKRLSKRAKELLSDGEGKLVDYKESVKGLHAEGLVAFANSAEGGAILIGVREVPAEHGLHRGEPIGCTVDDQARLQIMSKALSCSPAIQIDLVIENSNVKPFFRIEIPSGTHKPHATGSGTYKIREDGRNHSLFPDALLKLYLDREGEEFRNRFAEATSGLENRMSDAAASVEDLEHVVSGKIEEIGSSLGWAEYKASDAANTIETVEAKVFAISRDQEKLTKRLKSVLEALEAIDPVKREAEEEVLSYLREQLEEDPSILEAAKKGQTLSISLTGGSVGELSEEDVNRLFRQAVKEQMEASDDA